MKVYVANAPLIVDEDGERRVIPVGELVPPSIVARWHSRALSASIDTGRVLELDTDLYDRALAEHQERFGDPSTAKPAASDPDADVPVIGPADGPEIAERGIGMVRAPNPVWMLRLDHEFQVDTAEGRMHGNHGDFIVYDPISGHVWPVAAGYVETHYAPIGVTMTSGTATITEVSTSGGITMTTPDPTGGTGNQDGASVGPGEEPAAEKPKRTRTPRTTKPAAPPAKAAPKAAPKKPAVRAKKA